MPTGASAECRFRCIDPLSNNNFLYTESGTVNISDLARLNPTDKRTLCLLAVAVESTTRSGKLIHHCIVPNSTETDCPLAQRVSKSRKTQVFEFFPKEPAPTYSI